MKRIVVKELKEEECVRQIREKMEAKRISFQISPEEGWVQVDACGPCEKRLIKEKKTVEGCEKCVNMTLDIIKELGYTGELMTQSN